jgi:hypothetical protein
VIIAKLQPNQAHSSGTGQASNKFRRRMVQMLLAEAAGVHLGVGGVNGSVERRPDGFGPALRTSSERSVGRHGVIADCASVTLIPDPIEDAGTISAQD